MDLWTKGFMVYRSRDSDAGWAASERGGVKLALPIRVDRVSIVPTQLRGTRKRGGLKQLKPGCALLPSTERWHFKTMATAPIACDLRMATHPTQPSLEPIRVSLSFHLSPLAGEVGAERRVRVVRPKRDALKRHPQPPSAPSPASGRREDGADTQR